MRYELGVIKSLDQDIIHEPYSPQQRVRPMHEVTRILSAIEQGEPQAAEQLLLLVYDELRRLAPQHR